MLTTMLKMRLAKHVIVGEETSSCWRFVAITYALVMMMIGSGEAAEVFEGEVRT
jgi:hypothetical protein